MNINVCVVPSCRISVERFQPKFRLGDGVVGSFPPHLAGQGEGWSGGLVRSRERGVVVTGPLWQPKGHHQE